MSRHTRRRYGAGILMVVLLLLFTGLLAALLWLLFGGRGGETPSSGPTQSDTAPTTDPTASEPAATVPTVTEPSTAPPTTVHREYKDGHYLQTKAPDWNLILVNQWNWLDADYYQTLVQEYVTTYSKYGKMDSRVHEALTQMIDDANAAGKFGLYGAYLFRTVERSNNNWNKRVQQNLNKGYSQQEAERLAQSIQARGYTSEHNAGLAADLECTGYTGLNEDFDQSPAFAWLKENCCRYGFILRYPKEKQDITGVIYEPWHYRYVGVEAATEIMSRGICLEEYLEEKGL